jgi:NADPH:quinone reductase
MKSWVCPSLGVENAELREVPRSVIENPQDIVVRMKAGGLNPVDWKKCDWHAPRSIGIDGCGIVEEIGSEVDVKVFIPQKTLVYFHGPLNRINQGAFSEFYTIDSRYVSVVPQSLI